jgi:hypothetical protein
MKSGTTTLFDALARHTAVAPCTPKEPGFFAFEEVWAQGFEWYDALFPFDPQIHRFALDGSTDYTKRPFCEGVADRLAASAPREFHLIYIMRDPLRRLESHARHTQHTKREVGRCPSPRADHSLDTGISPVNHFASRYAYQLEPYRAFLDQGRLHLMTLEALQADYKGEIARVLDFLGLPREADTVQPRHSNNAAAKREATWISNRLRYSRYFRWLPTKTRLALVHRLGKQRDVLGRFRLTPEEEESLTKELGSDIERLRCEFGFHPPENWHF